MGGGGSIVQAGRIIAAVASVGTSLIVESALAGKRAKAGMETPARDAKAAADKQRLSADRLAADAAARRNQEETTAAETTAAATARQRQKAASAGGRRSTIATSPLGLTSEPDTNRKSLLGL